MAQGNRYVANVPSPSPTIPLVAATMPLPHSNSVPAINVELNQQSLEVYVLRDQLIRHLLQLNAPVGDDHTKAAVTLQHQLENLRLTFNPRDPNRTSLKAYSGMLSRIRDEVKADLQTYEISDVKILLDSLKRQSSVDNKPELRELYTRVARKESECITFDTFEEIL